MSAFAREAESALARAEAENWGYHRLLQHLAEAEVQDRRARKIERLLKYSGLPPTETFARFDEAKMPEKVRRMLPTLRSGDFVRRGDNLVAVGLPGRGKTGFCAALGRELLERHELKVLFVPAFKLAGRLLAAKRDLKLASALAKLNRFEGASQFLFFGVAMFVVSGVFILGAWLYKERNYVESDAPLQA